MVNLDLLPTADVVGLLLSAEQRVVPAVRGAQHDSAPVPSCSPIGCGPAGG